MFLGIPVFRHDTVMFFSKFRRVEEAIKYFDKKEKESVDKP